MVIVFVIGVTPLWWRAMPGAEFSPGPVSERAECHRTYEQTQNICLVLPERHLTHKLDQCLRTDSSCPQSSGGFQVFVIQVKLCSMCDTFIFDLRQYFPV